MSLGHVDRSYSVVLQKLTIAPFIFVILSWTHLSPTLFYIYCVLLCSQLLGNLTHFPCLTLVSFNANGLGQDSKRKLVFNKLKSLDLIILLQETHSIKTLEKNGKRIGKKKSISQMA